nr:hypothetical protein CTI12_AA001210 [Tanacetum cinerariifolium]
IVKRSCNNDSKAEHRLCARHIYANWYSDFRGEQLKVAFYVFAKCANEAQLQRRALKFFRNLETALKRKYKPKKSKTKLSRHGRDIPCGICSSVGHNYKTCPVDDGGKYQPKKSKAKKPTTKSATKNMPSLVLNP